MTNMLLIGGLGFLGSNISKKFTQLGIRFDIIDNMSDYGYLDKAELDIAHGARKSFLDSETTIFNFDINDWKNLDRILSNNHYDVIVYLAACPSVKACELNPDLAESTMISSLYHVSKHADLTGARLVFISSSLVYGNWTSSEIDESHILDPKIGYGMLKLRGERVLLDAIDEGQYLILRPTGLYGPLDVTDRVASRMAKAAFLGHPIKVHGDDTALDLVFVEDAAEMIVRAIINSLSGIYNVSSGSSIRLIDLAHHVKEIFGSKSQIIIEDVDNRYPQRGSLSSYKLRRDTGFTESNAIGLGLNRYFNYISSVFSAAWANVL